LFSLAEILQAVPSDYRAPVVHTLGSHITKEKPLFVYSLGKSTDMPERDVRLLAASIDMLWSLALIFDDIVDEDTQRAGEDAAWVVFGKEKAYKSAQAGLSAVFSKLQGRFGNQVVNRCRFYISSGIGSVAAHRRLTLDSSADSIINNYIQRANFHALFPVDAICSKTGEEKEREDAVKALREVNLAGQILNDFKDLTSQYCWIRAGFSDIRGGLVTVPIRYVWEKLNEEEKAKFQRVFGNNNFDESSRKFLEDCFSPDGRWEPLRVYIRELYFSSWWHFRQAVPKESLQSYFGVWVSYKLAQVDQAFEHQPNE